MTKKNSPSLQDASPVNTYRCGTLSYTKKGLFMLFAWLLWGDFCYTMMEVIIPSIIPLKLNSLGASSTLMTILLSTLPSLLNTTICPWVSFKSDNHRGRFGRRIPFILYSMPFLVISLFLIGFSSQLGSWLHDIFLSGGTISRTAVILGLLAIFLCMFDLFNMFVTSVISCLFNDVVPNEFLGRFMAWLRLVGVISSAAYQFFIFQYALSHMTEIYVAAGILYLVGFGVMCFKVKEGTYPPVVDDGEPPSLRKDIKSFAKTCFTIPYYWNIFLSTAFGAVSASIGIFLVFFQQSMGMELGMIGTFNGIQMLVLVPMLFFVGRLVDRFNPVRTEAYLAAFNLCIPLFGCVWIFASAPDSQVYFWVLIGVTCLGALSASMGQCATLPRFMLMFPSQDFGQFCGAQALVRSAAVMVGGLLAGIYLDVIKRFVTGDELAAYRFIYPWILVMQTIACIFHYRAYRYWRRLGAEDSIAPRTHFKYSELPKSSGAGVEKRLVIISTLTFSGYIGASLFLMFYFYFLAENLRNVMVFGILTFVLLLFFASYLRFLRFMERP
jgi:MFS family permease